MCPRQAEQAGEFVDSQTLAIVEFDELAEALNRIGAGAARSRAPRRATDASTTPRCSPIIMDAPGCQSRDS
jgi:hypothetical protein